MSEQVLSKRQQRKKLKAEKIQEYKDRINIIVAEVELTEGVESVGDVIKHPDYNQNLNKMVRECPQEKNLMQEALNGFWQDYIKEVNR